MPQVLADSVEELSTGFDAEPFDAAVGERVGAALVAAGLVMAAAPTAAVHPLRRLAEARHDPQAQHRVSTMLSAVVRGHRDKAITVPSTIVRGDHPSHAVTERLLRVALDNAAVAVAIGDLDGTVRYANPALGELLGVPPDALHTVSVFDFTHPDDVDDANAAFLDGIGDRSGTARVECRMVRTDGRIRWASVAVTYVPGSDGHPDTFVAVAEDVTERRRLQDELHWQSRHDVLTGLANRRLLMERIANIGTSAGPDARIGLCFADIDHFKHINDRYGHAVGDEVLTAVAHRLQTSVVDDEHTIARIGGDEFVVLVTPPADDARVAEVADALLSSLTTPIVVGPHTLPVSLSIGVVIADASSRPATTLLDHADSALYRAKADGRDRWAFRGAGTDIGPSDLR